MFQPIGNCNNTAPPLQQNYSSYPGAGTFHTPNMSYTQPTMHAVQTQPALATSYGITLQPQQQQQPHAPVDDQLNALLRKANVLNASSSVNAELLTGGRHSPTGKNRYSPTNKNSSGVAVDSNALRTTAQISEAASSSSSSSSSSAQTAVPSLQTFRNTVKLEKDEDDDDDDDDDDEDKNQGADGVADEQDDTPEPPNVVWDAVKTPADVTFALSAPAGYIFPPWTPDQWPAMWNQLCRCVAENLQHVDAHDVQSAMHVRALYLCALLDANVTAEWITRFVREFYGAPSLRANIATDILDAYGPLNVVVRRSLIDHAWYDFSMRYMQHVEYDCVLHEDPPQANADMQFLDPDLWESRLVTYVTAVHAAFPEDPVPERFADDVWFRMPSRPCGGEMFHMLLYAMARSKMHQHNIADIDDAKRAVINMVDADQRSLLLYACQAGNANMVHFMLENEVNAFAGGLDQARSPCLFLAQRVFDITMELPNDYDDESRSTTPHIAALRITWGESKYALNVLLRRMEDTVAAAAVTPASSSRTVSLTTIPKVAAPVVPGTFVTDEELAMLIRQVQDTMSTDLYRMLRIEHDGAATDGASLYGADEEENDDDGEFMTGEFGSDESHVSTSSSSDADEFAWIANIQKALEQIEVDPEVIERRKKKQALKQQQQQQLQ